MTQDFKDALQSINEGVQNHTLTKQSSDAMLSILLHEAEAVSYFDDDGHVEKEERVGDSHYASSGAYGLYSQDNAQRNLRHIFIRNKDGEVFFLNTDENGVLTGCTEKPVEQLSDFMDTYGPASLKGFETQQAPGFFANLFHSFRNSWLITKIFGKPTEPDEVDRYNKSQQDGADFLKRVGYTKSEAEPEAAPSLMDVLKENGLEVPESNEKAEEPQFPGPSDLNESVIYTDGTFVSDPNSLSGKLDALFNIFSGLQTELGREENDPSGLNLYKLLASRILLSKVSADAKKVENGETELDPNVQGYLDAVADISVNNTDAFRAAVLKQLGRDAKGLRSDKTLSGLVGNTAIADRMAMMNYTESPQGMKAMKDLFTKYKTALKSQQEEAAEKVGAVSKNETVAEHTENVEEIKDGPI